MQTTLNQILQKVFSTTNEEDIISTWFDEENQVIREQLMEMYDNKSSAIKTFSSDSEKNAWMSFEVYDTPKGKLLQQFGMPDSFWFLKTNITNQNLNKMNLTINANVELINDDKDAHTGHKTPKGSKGVVTDIPTFRDDIVDVLFESETLPRNIFKVDLKVVETPSTEVLTESVIEEEVKNSTKFKEGDITNEGKVEKAPTGDLLVNGHHIDEYPELKLLVEVKDFSTFTKFRKDLIVAHIVGKTPGIKSAAIGKEMKSLGYTNFSYDDIYYTLQRVLKTLEKETK